MLDLSDLLILIVKVRCAFHQLFFSLQQAPLVDRLGAFLTGFLRNFLPNYFKDAKSAEYSGRSDVVQE